MRIEKFSYDSRDNCSKIHAFRWIPDSENVVAVIQIVHGMAEYVERYLPLIEFLTEQNFVVTGEDHLGHGSSSKNGQIKGYFCEQDPATVVVRDVHRLKKITQEIYPGVPYFILGHSMGSYITRNYIYRYGSGIDGAIITGTGNQSYALLCLSKSVAAIQKFFCGSKYISRFIDRGAFSSYNKQIENPRTSYDWLTKDEKIVDHYIADENCGFTFTVNGFQTMFELIWRSKKRKNIEKIPKNLPIFMASGEEDPVGGYGRGVKEVFQAYKNAGISDIELHLYKDDRHELFNETDKEIIFQNIVDWLAKHLVNTDLV